jgi:parvulin-like peptidyl-prolyl isomerase
VEEAFGIVLFVVVGVAIVLAVVAISGAGRLYGQIGRGGLSLDRDDDYARRSSRGGGAVSTAERDAEVRQMLEARNERRVARGQEPLDLDAELARLTAPAADPALEAEIRSLVVARNERRERQGKPPLDVESEVARQLAELGGG